MVLLNFQQVRHGLWRNVRPILGWPRKTLQKMGRKYPEPHIYDWRPYYPENNQYTIKPLPILKMGGRDLENGRVVVRTTGGGNVKRYKWVDMHRNANEDGSVREEVVLKIDYDPLNTPKVALVADAERARWIFATHGIKVDDVIRTYSDIPRIPIKPKIGDAHPVGALPVGTKIHCVETTAGEGARQSLVAGSSCEITRRSSTEVTIKLPNRNTYNINANCMAVVGQLSNPDHNKYNLWCPQRSRWLGIRPRSGQWHRKDGYCGKKNKKPRAFDNTTASKMRDNDQPSESTYNLS